MPQYSSEALVRFQIVAQVLSLEQSGGSRAAAVREVVSRTHYTFGDQPRLFSPRSVYRWLAAYENDGLFGLERSARDTVVSKVLPESFLKFLELEKKLDPRASIPEIVRRAREYGITEVDTPIDRTTVYRACVRLGLYVSSIRGDRQDDSRRFAYPHRMDMVLSDGKHFRAGASRAKRVALFFLDDATRYVLHVVVGTSENADLFLRGLYELITKHGFMSILFLDHGPGFIADDTVAVVGNLERLLVHGKKAYPQGHGKIERFHRTVLADLLRSLAGRPDVDPTPSALELRIRHYLQNDYNHRPHRSLGEKAPHQVFHADDKPLELPNNHEELRSKFVVHEKRRVNNDNTVSVASITYDMPRGYKGMWVILHLKVLEGHRVYFVHEGELIRLDPTDLEANARSPRARRQKQQDDNVTHPPRKSAADLAYDRDLGPVVNPDGGFPKTEAKEPKKEDTND